MNLKYIAVVFLLNFFGALASSIEEKQEKVALCIKKCLRNLEDVKRCLEVLNLQSSNKENDQFLTHQFLADLKKEKKRLKREQLRLQKKIQRSFKKLEILKKHERQSEAVSMLFCK